MIPELRYELLFFYTRNELEHLQPVSQTLLDTIVKGAKALPLRPIFQVEMDCDSFGSKGNIEIYVEEDADKPDYVASINDGDFAETFRRLQHTCIKEICVKILESPFLRYWQAQESATFTVVSIDFELRETTDYDVLDSIVKHLRPRTTEEVHDEESLSHENGSNKKYLELLARDSFLNTLQACQLTVYGDAFPLAAFILSEPGYPKYKLWCKDPNVADGIDDFIESFVRKGCANKKLESVCIGWDDHEDEPTPAPKQLRKPTKIDMALPNDDMTAWLTRYMDRVSQCDMHSFDNTKQWMRMDVYKWSVEYDAADGRVVTRHIVLCRVTDV